MKYLLVLLLASCCTFRSDPSVLLSQTVKVSVEYMEVGPKGPVTSTAYGSGVTIASSAALSAVLTAAHVCTPPGSLMTGQSAVQRVTGPLILAEVLWQDPAEDLCILAVTGYTGQAVQLAQDLPPLGAEVTWTSGPLGLFGDGLGFVDVGHYAGQATVKSQSRLVVSGTTTHGASGAPIFYHGRLIGILVAVLTESGYVILASPIDGLRERLHPNKTPARVSK